MQISIVFRKIGFNVNIGKRSAVHRQVCNFSIDKMWLDNDGEVYFAKELVKF